MKTLIIKLGASGDVVRTTVLLSEIEGDIYWLTKKYNQDLLNSKKIKEVLFFEENKKDKLKGIDFDLIINLEEENEVLTFLSELNSNKFIGIFLNNGKVDYTSECDYWLDMSNISKKYSLNEADLIKFENKKSIPQILIEMIGKEWNEQEYDIGIEPLSKDKVKGRIGIIDVAESKWPNKYWRGYDSLKEKLQGEGYNFVSLGMRENLREHVNDINNCNLIVCGDTLGMHIALALRKKVVTLFNCTPPDEIYGYGRMIKVVSPLISTYFLKRTNNIEAQSAIRVNEVYNAIQELLKS